MNRSNKILSILKEAKSKRNIISLEKLPFKLTDLEPVMSEDTIKYHYGKLASGYVLKYNENIGDPDFNESGAFLHNMFFPQLSAPKSGNKPAGKSKDFIENNFKSFDNFKDQFKSIAMKVQGSGWVYLSRNGEIKVIKNHQIRRDIILIIDWWEHAWALDYQHDKEKYLNNIWRIINWNTINNRIV